MDVPDPASRLRAALGGSGAGSSDYDLNPGIELPEGRRLRPAAVLVALRPSVGGGHVVLTKRSSKQHDTIDWNAFRAK